MVLSALSDYNIAYNDVMGFTTDNASVMVASFRNVLKPVLLKSVHLCWLAHQMNLVVRVIIKEFPEATSWCQDFNSYFCRSGARSYRYQQHLDNIGEGRKKHPNRSLPDGYLALTPSVTTRNIFPMKDRLSSWNFWKIPRMTFSGHCKECW